MLTAYLFIFACTLLVLHLFFSWRNNTFKKLGISGPKPKLLVGNLFDVFGEGKLQPFQLQKWTKEYGSLYGYYEGGRPILVTADPDFVQELLVKQFSRFHGRKEFPIQSNPDKGGDRLHMFVARGAQWKRLRMISNPTFTSAKIKQMMPKIHISIEEMLSVLEKKRLENKSFDIYSVYQSLTLDVIARVAFAYESSVQNDPNNELLRFCSAIFRTPPTFFFVAASLFPSLRRLLYYYIRMRSVFHKGNWDYLRERIDVIIQQKKQQNATGATDNVDFIQLMLDAEADPTSEGTDFKGGATNGAIKDTEIKKKLTPGEIASQSLLFILAGFETTSTALGFVTYLLSTHPEVQKMVLDEIDEHISTDEDITYEKVQKLKYLECVIQESLRLYPPAIAAVTRCCMESCAIKGVSIPKGMDVAVDVMSLHYNEDLWGMDAKEFKPERFLSKSLPHPYAYMPFGAGPRICIGMRFAQLEMKIALCSILKRYHFEECPQTEKPLQLRFSQVTLAPKNGVFVTLKKRE